MPVHSALPQAKQGRLKVLGVVNGKRVAVAPEVPTLQEAGGPNLEASVWYQMYAPARTPPEVVSRLSAVIDDILKQKDVVESLDKQGLTVFYQNSLELLALMRKESVRWAAVVKEKNLKGE